MTAGVGRRATVAPVPRVILRLERAGEAPRVGLELDVSASTWSQSFRVDVFFRRSEATFAVVEPVEIRPVVPGAVDETIAFVRFLLTRFRVLATSPVAALVELDGATRTLDVGDELTVPPVAGLALEADARPL